MAALINVYHCRKWTKTRENIGPYTLTWLITVAARSRAWTVFARYKTGIVDWNPTQGMDACIVCVYSVFVLFCVQAEALRRADLPRAPTDCE
jgi:hypothetical protein